MTRYGLNDTRLLSEPVIEGSVMTGRGHDPLSRNVRSDVWRIVRRIDPDGTEVDVLQPWWPDPNRCEFLYFNIFDLS